MDSRLWRSLAKVKVLLGTEGLTLQTGLICHPPGRFIFLTVSLELHLFLFFSPDCFCQYNYFPSHLPLKGLKRLRMQASSDHVTRLIAW